MHKLSVDNCVTTSQNLITSTSNTPIPINAVDAGSTLTFACGVGNHCESGMKGQVVVRVTTPTLTPKPTGRPTAQPTRHPTRHTVATGATTPAPSPRPSKTSSCVNSATWYQAGKPANSCSKVTTASRCAWVSFTGITAKVVYPLGCGSCT